jgi:hypothetical protein
MRAMSAAILLVFTMTLCGVCESPARVGSAFADIYDAFAPLSVFHRSYADFLFYGSDVDVPSGISDACERTGILLGLLQIGLLEQTGSLTLDGLPRLARLRADLAIFCDRFSQTLGELDGQRPPDLQRLKEASGEGLFSGIYDLQLELQAVFERVLAEFTEEPDTWAFGVAFALRTLLNQMQWDTIHADLRSILYGSEEAMTPPSFLQAALVEDIQSLSVYIDVPLDDEAAAVARALAQRIYAEVMAGT